MKVSEVAEGGQWHGRQRRLLWKDNLEVCLAKAGLARYLKGRHKRQPATDNLFKVSRTHGSNHLFAPTSTQHNDDSCGRRRPARIRDRIHSNHAFEGKFPYDGKVKKSTDFLLR